MSDTRDSSSSISNSSDSEEDEEILRELCNRSKLKPYDFEPLASSDENNEDEETIEDHSEVKNTNQRKGNTSWCLCGCCKIMEYERECWCCQEANEIADELFEGNLEIL